MALDVSGLRARVLHPAVTRLIAAMLGAALVTWSGVRVSRAGDARREELRRARSTLATFADWQRRFRPAVAAESIAWRRTLIQLEALGVVGDERLALTRLVGQAAESAGLRDVRVRIVSPDTTGGDERLSIEGVRRQFAPFALLVEGRGSLQALVTFLGELPSSVAPTTMTLVRQNGNARHRLSLAVYELQPSNGSSSSTVPSSVERRDPRALGVRRPGR